MKFANSATTTRTILLVSIFILIAILLSVSFLPIPAEADGLVPCGGDGEPGCSVCHLVTLANNVINFIVQISFVVASLLFAYAGFLFFTGGTNPTQITNAKKIFTNTFIGIIIILTSWLVVNVILKTLVDEGVNPFTRILCQDRGQTDPGDGALHNLGVDVSPVNTTHSNNDVDNTRPPLTGPGSGADSYASTPVSSSQFCSDVRGNGWTGVDDRFCDGTVPSGQICCGQFPSTSGTTVGTRRISPDNISEISRFISTCVSRAGSTSFDCITNKGYDTRGDEICLVRKYTCTY